MYWTYKIIPFYIFYSYYFVITKHKKKNLIQFKKLTFTKSYNNYYTLRLKWGTIVSIKC